MVVRVATPRTLLTTIDVADVPGANLGAKLQAAHDALPAGGGILDCRRLGGAQTISVGIAVTKPVMILFGASVITCGAPSIAIDLGPAASGSLIAGCGQATVFRSVGGNTVFRIYGTGAGTDAAPTGDSYGVVIRDLWIDFTAQNAASRGVVIDHSIVWRLQNLRLTNPSAGAHLGKGIDGLAALTGVVDQCEIRHFDKGAHWRRLVSDTSNCNAVKLTNSCNVFHNNTGVEWDDFTSAFLVNCVIEQNDVGVRLNDGNEFFSMGNHYENDFGPTQPAGSGINAIVTAGNAPHFVGDEFNISGGGNGRDVQYMGTNVCTMIACKTTAGVTVGASGRLERVYCFRGGVDVTAGAQIVNVDSVSMSQQMNVGTAVDATGVGDLGAGLVGAARLFYDQSDGSLGLYTVGGSRAVYLQAATAAAFKLGLINGTNSGFRMIAEQSGFDKLECGHGSADTAARMRLTRANSVSPMDIFELVSDNIQINDIAGTIDNQIATRAAQSTVWNEQGLDIDQRAEGDNKPNCLLLDGSEDEVSVDGRFSLRALTPAQLTGNVNDYNPEVTATDRASTWRLSSDASRNITGIAGGLNGRLLYLVNVGANPIVLKNQDAGSADANKIITGTGADVTLAADGVAVLQYDSVTTRWRVLSSR